jgi:hypothetical protein
VNRPESKYVEKKAYLSRYAHERLLAQRESPARLDAEFNEWFGGEGAVKFIPFLTKECGWSLGRVMEIGAGGLAQRQLEAGGGGHRHLISHRSSRAGAEGVQRLTPTRPRSRARRATSIS